MPYTDVLVFSVAYIAADATFPYHLNSFDNVPVNLTFGEIVNITDRRSYIQTFSNDINYTKMCSTCIFNTFNEPYFENKILLFTSTIEIAGFDNNEVKW